MVTMKKFLILFMLISILPTWAQDSYIYNNLTARIDKVGSPLVDGDYIIFTADSSSRHVGIAFDFENFRTSIHSRR